MSTEQARWQRIEELFHEALAMTPAERPGFVARIARDDADLAAQLQRLLQADQSDAAVTDAVAGAAQGLANVSQQQQIGRTIGAWRLLDVIGSGGMGTVYRAERVDGTFRAIAALKMLNPWLLGSGFEKRFEFERQILADLHHPAIAHLLDGGLADDGVPYLVLELVDGEIITEYAADKALTLDARIALMLDVCDAVQQAHQNLIVHRDLKPGNILVDREGHPKLLDFGIAKLMMPAGSTVRSAAEPATRLLTPEYASPEQLRGEAVSTASDVYALGVILYELITGARPGTSEEILKPGWAPTRPSTMVTRGHGLRGAIAIPEPRRWAKRLRGDLDTVVLKALAPDPARRYATVRELSDDLRAMLESRPVRARPDSLRYRTRLFLRRNRLAVALSGVMVGLALAAGIALVVLALRLRDERDQATAARARAEQSARTAQRTADFMASLFQTSNPRNQGGGTTARELLDAGAKRMQTELADEPVTLAYLLSVIGGIDRQLGLYDAARAALERAVELRRQYVGSQTAETADSLSELAEVLRELSDFDGSERMQREALAIRRNLKPPNLADVGESLNNLALTIKEAGRFEEALPIYAEALEARTAVFGRADPNTIVTLINIGMLERDSGRLADAEVHLREVLTRRLELFGERHMSTANALSNLGMTLEAQGKYADAEALIRRALDARVAVLGDVHPDVASSLEQMAHILENEGRLQEAETYYQKSIAVDLKSVRPDHPDVAAGRSAYARVLGKLGRYAEAEPILREALQNCIKGEGKDHPRAGRIGFDLAQVLAAQGKYDEALQQLQITLRIRREKLSPGHQDIGWTLIALANVELKLGRSEAAAGHRAEGLAQLDHALVPGHPKRALVGLDKVQ